MSWFTWPRTPKRLVGSDFLDLVKSGSLEDIHTQLAHGADPNETVTGWMEVATPLDRGVDRGELAVVLALLQAGGRFSSSLETLENVILQRPEWIPAVAPFVPADAKTVSRIVACGPDALDGFAQHWDRPTRQRLLTTHADQLPRARALEREAQAMASESVAAPTKRQRARP